MAADYTAYDLFSPEDIQILFKSVETPDRLFGRLFGQPRAMGLYEFSMATMDDPYAMLPPVGDMEDAKEMMASQELENYILQDYRGYVDISDKLVNQWASANKLPQLLAQVRERYIMPIREAVDNTVEYTCFHAMDLKKAVLATSHDWTSAIATTTADHVIEDLTLARKAYITATKKKPTVAIHNPEAASQILLRKDLHNRFYFPNNDALESGELGRYLGMGHDEQVGGYKDFEGNALTMFAPTTASKNLTYLLDPATFGYPVVFGSPKFTTEDMPGKEAMRVYVSFHAGFVYNKDTVSAITV